MRAVSSRVGIFSDIHIGLGQNSQACHESIIQMANWIRSVYKEHNINDIFIPGDIFHNRNEISVNTLDVGRQFFEILKDFNIFVSTGNHDCYYKEHSKVNSISLFKHWDNITVVDEEPVVWSIGNTHKKIAMIPWGTNISDIPDNLEYCLGHFEINSFKLNNSTVCEHGIDSETLLEKTNHLITGHFHKKSYRTYRNNKSICYLGSPYQQNFGDVDEERGIYIFDLIKNEHFFIENKISPKHLKISLTNILSKKLKSDFLKENIPNNMISLIIDENIQPENLVLITSKLQKLNPKFFRVEYKLQDSKFILNESSNQYDSIDVTQNISDFVQAMDISYKNEVFDYLKTLYLKLT